MCLTSTLDLCGTQGNFTLSGLIGRELHRKTVGIVGTGAIGQAAAKIWKVGGPYPSASACRVSCVHFHQAPHATRLPVTQKAAVVLFAAGDWNARAGL